MNDICLSLCFAYLGGFVATFALAVNYIFENRAAGRKGFAGLRTLYVWCGSLVCAALWPVIAIVLFKDVVAMSLKREDNHICQRCSPGSRQTREEVDVFLDATSIEPV